MNPTDFVKVDVVLAPLPKPFWMLDHDPTVDDAGVLALEHELAAKHGFKPDAPHLPVAFETEQDAVKIAVEMMRAAPGLRMYVCSPPDYGLPRLTPMAFTTLRTVLADE